jgi:hypothetical protein
MLDKKRSICTLGSVLEKKWPTLLSHSITHYSRPGISRNVFYLFLSCMLLAIRIRLYEYIVGRPGLGYLRLRNPSANCCTLFGSLKWMS